MTQIARPIILLLLTILINQEFCYAKDDSTKVRRSILKVARKISKYPSVDRGPVGFSAELTKQYERSMYLREEATDNELIALTNHKNPKVRAYAFEALVVRHHKEVRKILEDHISDTTTFKIRSGCMSSVERINFHFLRLLTPSVLEKTSPLKLTRSEAEAIKARMVEAIEVKHK